jgi:hypothetical protein
VKPHRLLAARAPRRRVLWPALLVALAGCTKQDEIAVYDTPRAEAPTKRSDPDAVRAVLDHMFTAIVPAGDQAWFFKLVAPGAVAEELRRPFDDFVRTVEVERGDKRPTWTLPEGWREEAGNAMRAATIIVPHDDEEFELTVSSLPLGDDWPAYLTQNVNRWMGQLQQQPLDATVIEKLARPVPTATGNATVIELVGTMQASPMAGGAGMPADHPPIAASTTPATAGAAEEAEGNDSDSEANAESTAGQLRYETPEGWAPGPPSSMRKASFTVAGGKGEAALFVFPATGEMADPRANAERWAAPLGLTALTDEQYDESHSDVDFGGLAGHKFEFFSPEGTPDAQGILAALAVDGDQVWSMKLTGDRATVESQRAAFDKFLASIRFPGKP